MRKTRSIIVAGVAAIALAGIAGPAEAQSRDVHVMTVVLPGGGVEQIHYTGAVAPTVSIRGVPAPAVDWPAFFGPSSPFAAFDRISAEMDRQADALLRQAALLSAQPTATAMRNLPAGSQGYTFISTLSGNGVCTRSVEITSQGDGTAPRVVSHTSGDCAGAPDSRVPARQPAPARQAPTIETRNVGAHPYAGLIREAALR